MASFSVSGYTEKILSITIGVVLACSVCLPILASATIPTDMENHDALVAILGIVPIAVLLGLALAAFRGVGKD